MACCIVTVNARVWLGSEYHQLTLFSGWWEFLCCHFLKESFSSYEAISFTVTEDNRIGIITSMTSMLWHFNPADAHELIVIGTNYNGTLDISAANTAMITTPVVVSFNFTHNLHGRKLLPCHPIVTPSCRCQTQSQSTVPKQMYTITIWGSAFLMIILTMFLPPFLHVRPLCSYLFRSSFARFSS